MQCMNILWINEWTKENMMNRFFSSGRTQVAFVYILSTKCLVEKLTKKKKKNKIFLRIPWTLNTKNTFGVVTPSLENGIVKVSLFPCINNKRWRFWNQFSWIEKFITLTTRCHLGESHHIWMAWNVQVVNKQFTLSAQKNRFIIKIIYIFRLTENGKHYVSTLKNSLRINSFLANRFDEMRRLTAKNELNCNIELWRWRILFEYEINKRSIMFNLIIFDLNI